MTLSNQKDLRVFRNSNSRSKRTMTTDKKRSLAGGGGRRKRLRTSNQVSHSFESQWKSRREGLENCWGKKTVPDGRRRIKSGNGDWRGAVVR